MCGIVGIVRAGGVQPADRDRVAKAVEALRHRGPDANGVHAEPRCVLGHTRLSIVDLAGGRQPMRNEDGSVLAVFNGEIWNHLELRRQLEQQGHRFATRSDTEVLVHGYEEWGDRLPSHLNGMFAFAIWDGRSQRLLLARDRLGKKPLYVAELDRGLVFGSDARSVLLAGGRKPEVESEHLGEFLFQRYVGGPRTLFKGISRLEPGHVATFEDARKQIRRYWSVDPQPERDVAPEELRPLLLDAVAKRLMSDVPLGVLLSGGVDSASVLGLMREAGASSLSSFTIGFDDALYDERPLARVAAASAETDHHELVVGAEDFLAALPRLAWYRDEPLAETSEVPLLLLAELAGRHVKVVLSGDGGDEVFGGYPKYRAERLLRMGPAGSTCTSACRQGACNAPLLAQVASRGRDSLGGRPYAQVGFLVLYLSSSRARASPRPGASAPGNTRAPRRAFGSPARAVRRRRSGSADAARRPAHVPAGQHAPPRRQGSHGCIR